VFLNYAFENVGASGVGKIEVWATRDQGRTWQKLSEDPQRRNPTEVQLPGEGTYGLKLVVSNGRGFGAQPPQAGDPSDWWVEVDTTRPRVNITGVRCGAGADAGTLTILWHAEDKNLSGDCIEMFFAANREGPWTPIAKGLKNEGQYRWTPPAQAGAQAYLRIVARDRAGNFGLSETLQPVPLDDLSRPRIRLLNVTTTPHAAPTPAAVSNPVSMPPLASGALMPVQATSLPYADTPSTGFVTNPGIEIR
jgi:hypothetical protein